VNELTQMKILKSFLRKQAGRRIKLRRISPVKEDLRRRLDEMLLPFRTARSLARHAEMERETGSWLRAVRQATGIPVDTMRRKLRVTKTEIFRLERAERSSRILLGTLRQAAAALDCELVYALVPRKGTLEDLAQKQMEIRERARKLREERMKENEDSFDWRPWMRRFFRREMRKLGLRVR